MDASSVREVGSRGCGDGGVAGVARVDEDEDVLGLESLATHRVPLEDAPAMYETFQKKQDGCIKVVLTP